MNDVRKKEGTLYTSDKWAVYLELILTVSSSTMKILSDTEQIVLIFVMPSSLYIQFLSEISLGFLFEEHILI